MDAYDLGFDAGRDGTPKEWCPFDEDHEDYDEWIQGWWDGRHGVHAPKED